MNPMEQTEWTERRAKFLEKYKELIDEFQCDFISIPQFVPNERGTYDVVLMTDVMDKKNMAVRSPFIEQ